MIWMVIAEMIVALGLVEEDLGRWLVGSDAVVAVADAVTLACRFVAKLACHYSAALHLTSLVPFSLEENQPHPPSWTDNNQGIVALWEPIVPHLVPAAVECGDDGDDVDDDWSGCCC